MKPIIALAAGVLPLAALQAQSPDDAALGTKSPAAVRFALLEGEYDAAMKKRSAAFRAIQKSDKYKALREAEDDDGLRALYATVEKIDMESFLEKFGAAAKQYEGTEDAVDYLMWIARYGRGHTEIQNQAVDTLINVHLASPRIERFVEVLPWLIRGHKDHDMIEVIDRVLELTPKKSIRAQAHFSRAQSIQRNNSASDEHRALAAKDLAKAKELAKGTLLGLRIEGPEFKKNRLQIGMTAPDIAGVDTNGVKFKLSDYRGKVVVLDFWGDW